MNKNFRIIFHPSQTELNHTKPNSSITNWTQPNQTKPNSLFILTILEYQPHQTKPNSTKPNQTHSHQTKLIHTKPNSSIPNRTHPHHTKLIHTKPNSTAPNQTKPDNSQPNLTNPNKLGMQCIAESYPAFAYYLLLYSVHSCHFTKSWLNHSINHSLTQFCIPRISVLRSRHWPKR